MNIKESDYDACIQNSATIFSILESIVFDEISRSGETIHLDTAVQGDKIAIGIFIFLS